MSDNEGTSATDASFSMPALQPSVAAPASPSPAREAPAVMSLPPPEVSAHSELAEVSKILKSTADSDPLEDKEQFYPLQQKTAYMPPVTTLTSDSKRIIRQAQAPILQASPRVVHFLYEARIEELEDELDKERKVRLRNEKQRTDLAREIEDAQHRLDEAGGVNSTQAELNRRRETEITKIKRDLETTKINHDTEVSSLRKRNQELMIEFQEQMEAIQRQKSKVDKDNALLNAEVADLRVTVENARKMQANTEKHNKHLEEQLRDAKNKVDDANRNCQDMEVQKRKIALQKAEIEKQFQEAEEQLQSMEKIKDALKREVEDSRTALAHESQERYALLTKYKGLELDLDAARKLIEDDDAIKAGLHNQISSALKEVQEWKSKFESAGYVLREEMEEMRKKLSIRLQEADAHIEQLNAKNSGLEKAKMKLANDCEELANELERAHVIVVTSEKRIKSQEKEIMEWKARCEDLASELDASQKECREFSTQLFKLKATHEELLEQFDSVKRENKNLQDEIKDLLDQLAESSRTVHELETTKKRLSHEKEELSNALAEVETALEVEENKVFAAQQALDHANHEHDRRMREREEEFDGIRKNMQKALDQLQISLEQEARGRAEALKQKKKLEGDIVELELALDAANKAHQEALQFIHKLQLVNKELQVALDHEQRAKEEAQELFAQSERKCQSLHNELDQTRTLLELSDKKCRNMEHELAEVNEYNTELSAANAAISNSKRKLEGEHQILKADYDDALNEIKSLDDRCKKAILDAARLADELKEEQDHAQTEERARKILEEEMKEMKFRLEEAEQAALNAGRKTIAKLESRVRELSGELESEQRKYTESSKNLRKADRRIKEQQFEGDEMKKNMEHLQELADKLSAKCKAYKRQIEEAEEIAALNMAKYRKLTTELEEAEDRADLTQQNFAKLRAKTRSSVSVARAMSPMPHQPTHHHQGLDTQQLLNEIIQ